MRILFFIIVTLVLLSPLAYGSAASCDSSVDGRKNALVSISASLNVHSNISGVKIYLDTMFLGVTPLDSVSVEGGTHIMKSIHPDSRSWLQSSIVETVVVQAGEHLNRMARFPVVYRITSEPYGAEIRLGDSVVGRTPLSLPLTSEKAFVTFSMEGFDDETVPVTSETREVHVLLRSKTGSPSDPNSFLSLEQSKNSLPLYITTGATVVTGLAAAYMKIKADNYYGSYRQTGDVARLDHVRRLDLLSGISLAASQLSLLTLTYFLLSR